MGQGKAITGLKIEKIVSQMLLDFTFTQYSHVNFSCTLVSVFILHYSITLVTKDKLVQRNTGMTKSTSRKVKVSIETAVF